MQHEVQLHYLMNEKLQSSTTCLTLLLVYVRAETRNQMIRIPVSLSVWFLFLKMETIMFMIHFHRQVDMTID